MKNIVLLVIIAFLLTGCRQTDEITFGGASSLIFQSEYTNYAWGYSHNGWLLDTSGQVKRFQKSAKWIFQIR